MTFELPASLHCDTVCVWILQPHVFPHCGLGSNKDLDFLRFHAWDLDHVVIVVSPRYAMGQLRLTCDPFQLTDTICLDLSQRFVLFFDFQY